LGIREWFMDRNIRNMSKDEKQSMMDKMMDKMFEGMTSQDRLELMTTMMPTMMSQMLSDTSTDQRAGLMGEMMPRMMSQMFGREGGMPAMMARMRSTTSGEKEEESPKVPTMKTHEDFKPWEFCPCRKFCKEAFKNESTN